LHPKQIMISRKAPMQMLVSQNEHADQRARDK